MVFKITVARQPTAVEFEAGSISEAIGVMESESADFTKLFGFSFTAAHEQEAQGGIESPEPGKKERKPRTPRAEASAPAPLAIPGAPAPPAPPNVTEGANGIPAFLDRTASQAPPPPPLMPAAPPIAPVSGPVGQKVIAELERRGTTDEAKKQIVDWLAMPTVALIVPGSTFAESISCLRLIGDDKLGGVATALGL